ncbi:MAG TPA: alpha-1,2-fucosyltransferase [Desulfuromonadales bacterium]|nr:alpha-1,2-fucosyltransferase [Desulfuromonadales bacterium]
MIIVKLSGGLGNQMFQYAAGRRLAFHRNVPLKLDSTGFAKAMPDETVRHYVLDVFNLSADYAHPEEVAELCRVSTNPIMKAFKTAARTFQPLNMQTFFKERYFHFDPDMLLLGNNVYLDGYWQSEKYFLDVQEVIRKDFTVSAPIIGINLDISRKIMATNSVSIHVRRGDYVTNPIAEQYHGQCSLQYYQRAVEYVADITGDPHLMIFSDDIRWVQGQLQLKSPMTFVEHNGPELACEDLRLMSLCKHNIIANSSFSWWGAWLNRNPEKIIVAPEHWFKRQDISTTDLIPSAWHRI